MLKPTADNRRMRRMTEVAQEQAERLALQARRKMLAGEYETAIESQRKAVAILQDQLDDLEREPPASADEREESAHRLADYWGRLGGIYRRAKMVPEGIEAYEMGKELERRYQLDDSYNRTNWIVLTLLQDPSQLEALGHEIDESIAIIQTQVRGPRRGEWWAWADLGLVCHLCRRTDEARAAYEHFRQAGARPADYQSVLSVLESLRAVFLPSAPGLAAELGATIHLLETWESES